MRKFRRDTLVGYEHEYTRENIPWEMDDASESTPLLRYMRGGGVRAFGCTSLQAIRLRRLFRFRIISGIIFLVWFLLWIF